MQKLKTNGIILRSKAKWVEEGEKNSKHFLNLKKRNYKTTYIKKLITDDGNEITEQNSIIEEQFKFYNHLYT